MQQWHFPTTDEARDTPIACEERPVSFAGNGALVLVVVTIIAMGSVAAVKIYDILDAACSNGCPL